MGIMTEKYLNAVLYLCNELGGAVRGKKKLAKLLYYIDFDRYEFKESAKTITGDTYLAWKMGPVPKHFAEIIAKLEKKGVVRHTQEEGSFGYSATEVFTSVAKPDMSVFDEDDKYILKRVVDHYGRLNGKELEALTHAEAPFIATEQSEDIIFDLAFYRGTDFSDVVVRA